MTPLALKYGGGESGLARFLKDAAPLSRNAVEWIAREQIVLAK